MIDKKTSIRNLKFCISIFFIIAMTGCIGNNGDKILMVAIADKDDKLSEQVYVENSFKKGGWITINVDLGRKIEEKFDEKYAVFDKKREFLTTPALLNFIGGNGWKLNSPAGFGQGYIFTKSRGIFG